MKLIILRLNVASKPPPIFKGVTEIIINSQSCKGINLTTRHTRAKRASRVAIVHDMIKETIRTHLTLVHIFHTNASVDNSWVAHALSWCTLIRYGRITSVLATHYASKFAGLYILYVSIHNWVLVHLGSTDTGLNWHRQGLPPCSSEFMIQTTLNLPIQYSPLSPNYPIRPLIMPT
jgi:hypothetical protein